MCLVWWWTVGCRHVVPVAPDPLCEAPIGSPDQLGTPAGVVDRYGFAITVAPIERCGTSGTIAITGSGHRRFVMPPEVPTCSGRPDPADPCTTLRPDDFGDDVQARLVAAGVVPTGHGMGACGTLGTWDDWNFGISVQRWIDADPAIEVVADRLRAWRVGATYHVSVRPLMCSVSG
jgi:hypothetical protein